MNASKTTSERPARVLVVDAVRGLAVLCMIQWHCADAWIGGAIREGGAFERLRIVGGLAAPFFILLAGVSSAGFSSPIGLSQGKFNIDRAGGTAKVANGRDFRDMTANIPASQATSGLAMRLQRSAARANDAGLDEFKQLVRERAARVTK